MDERRLRSLPLFTALSKRELRELCRCVDEIDVTAGKVLVREGDFAYEVFIVAEGTAEVQRGGERLGVLRRGDVFGEMGAIDESRVRNAEVIATSPMTLGVMTARQFRHTMRTVPSVAERIRAEIERRAASLDA